MSQDNRESILAWFQPARGPEDWPGVRLAYIDPIKKHFERALMQANKDKDTPRALSLLHSRSYYNERGQRYFTPDAGWWMSKQNYIDGKGGWSGVTREQVEAKYKNITIFDSGEEAIAAAEEAGII